MAKGLITFDQYVQEKGFDNKTVNRFWKYCNQDIRNKETGDVEWWGREATNHNDIRGYFEEFDNLFEEFKNINSSRQIKSSWDNGIGKDNIRYRLFSIYTHANWEYLQNITQVPEDDRYYTLTDAIHDISHQFDSLEDIKSFLLTCKSYGFPNVDEKLAELETVDAKPAYKGSRSKKEHFWQNWFSKDDDALDRRQGLKDLYSDGYWELLDEVEDINDPRLLKIAPKLFYSAEDIRTFLLECARENLPGARDRLIKLNRLMGINSSRRNNMIKSAYTREDYDRFDEVGNFIPYKPTEEELAKKDEIKKVLEQELSDAYEPDPMDDYVGYDSTNERIDMACERVAKQFGVDTDFVVEIAGEIDKENIARQSAEPEYVYQHCKDKDRFWDWYNGEDVSLEELGIDKEQMDKEVDEVVRKYVNSSRQIKSELKKLTYIEPNNLQGLTDFIQACTKDGVTNIQTKVMDDGYIMVLGEEPIRSSRQIKSSTVTSDKQFRLIDTEHNDPKDGEDFTAEELRNYISKNDKYFDNAGLDYTIVDLNTGEEMNISTFRLNSSRQIKSSTVPRTTKELADWMRTHTGWDVDYDEENDVFFSGPESEAHYIEKGQVVTDGDGWTEVFPIDEWIRMFDEGDRWTSIKSALDTVKVTFDNGDTIVTDYNADVGREEIAKYYMHNYFNVGNEDEMHQVVKVEFPGNINSARVPEKADLDMAYQLEGYIESDHAMYDQFIVPVVKNLERKMKRGIFDYDKSLIMWQRVADEGAKRYVKELGGPSYNVATRKEVAKNLAEYYKENYDVNGDIYNPIN